MAADFIVELDAAGICRVVDPVLNIGFAEAEAAARGVQEPPAVGGL